MKIKLECDKEVAYDSLDYLNPLGTMQDNSMNQRFNKKFYKLYNNNKSGIKVLDLGCSGGGFVRECINDGCLGLGLEGSDYSKKLKRAEWAIIPEFLFTCDISKNFQFFLNNTKMKFNLITAWEVLEHIKEEDLLSLFDNIKGHLSGEGLFICSISTGPSSVNGVELHQTRKPKDWWVERFKEHDLYERKELYKYFNHQYIRGRKEKDWNFHIILSLGKEQLNPPTLSLKEKLKDFWIGSRAQIILQYLVTGTVNAG